MNQEQNIKYIIAWARKPQHPVDCIAQYHDAMFAKVSSRPAIREIITSKFIAHKIPFQKGK
jgi:hypothetical protein